MDTYLEIARTILKSARRPLSARAILRMAYKAQVVPSHLYGKTQHKTLQARLSEDILHNRSASAFFRTEPGKFFLNELINDPDIPGEWKTPFPARRRLRDLDRPDTLTVNTSYLKRQSGCFYGFWDFFSNAERDNALSYIEPENYDPQIHSKIWTFTCVVRNHSVLSYRIGRYRENRDNFTNKKTIGFRSPLSSDDLSLFSEDPIGAEECSLHALMYDLDLSYAAFDGNLPSLLMNKNVFVYSVTDTTKEVVVLLKWNCPDWFEPTTRRLSLNDPTWLGLPYGINNYNDIEPWSVIALSNLAEKLEPNASTHENNLAPTGSIPRI